VRIRSIFVVLSFAMQLAVAQVADNPMGDRGVAYTMSFQVIDRSSQPVKNAIVDVYGFSGSRLMGAMTSSEGRVMFRVTPGTYIISVKGNDIEDAKADFRVERYDGDRFEQITVSRKTLSGATAPSGVITAAMAAVPDKARSEFAKGEAKLQQKDFAAAKQYFEKATKIYPHYAVAFNGIGIAELRTKNIDAAAAAFQNAITADDQHPTAYLNLGKLYILQRDAVKALPFLQRAVALNPRDPEAQAQLSFAQFATGDCPSALATAARVHTAPHKQGELVHLVAGTCYEAAGVSNKARTEYELYLAEAPEGPQAAQAKAALDRLNGPK
jgi:Flp pilus assembly protein TadD